MKAYGGRIRGLLATIIPACAFISAAVDVPLYTVHEVTFKGPEMKFTDRPIETVDFYTEWQHKSGSPKYKIHGFWDGNGNGGKDGNVWRVRFCPTKTGGWEMVKVSSGKSELNGQNQGLTINCTPSDKKGFWEGNGRWYQRSNGEFTYTTGNCIYCLPALDSYLSDISKMTGYYDRVRFNVAFHPACERYGKFPFLNASGQQSNRGSDACRINIDYFANRIDKMVELAEERDFILDMYVEGQNHAVIEHPLYMRYIAARYGSYPHVWMQLNMEWNEYMSPGQVKDLGNKMRDFMAYPTPWSTITGGGLWPDGINGPWTHANIQAKTRSFTGSADAINKSVGLIGGKPANYDETGPDHFEGPPGSKYASEGEATRIALGSFFGGGYSCSGYKTASKEGQYFHGNFDPNKHKCSDNLGYMTQMINQYVHFGHMKPDNGVLSNASGALAMSWAGKQYVAGSDKGIGGARISLGSGQYRVVTFDIMARKMTEGPSNASGTFSFDFPNSASSMVVFTNSDVKYPMAGGEQDPPADDTPPSAPSNLSATAVGKTQIDLTWGAASDGESGIAAYKVYRNGDEIASEDKTSYSDQGLAEGTPYTYRVSAVNGEGMEGGKSNEASASTGSDEEPPRLVSVVAPSETSVKAAFNEPVTRASAEATANYQISGGITVHAASLESDEKSVILTTSAQAAGTTYTLTVSNISDKASTANAGGGQMEFSFSGELRIANLAVASGKAYEIVQNVAEGDKRYIDRQYQLESVDDLAGTHYIRTANDDVDAEDESFLSFDVSRPVTVYVAYRHGSDLPPWLSSWAKAGDQVCGDGCSEIYRKDFDAGTVTLGGNRPGGAGNMYVVFVDHRKTAALSPPDVGYSTRGLNRIDVRVSSSSVTLGGLRPVRQYALEVIDARGNVSTRRGVTGPRGTLSFTHDRPSGIYVLKVRSGSHQWSGITVLP